MRYIDAEKLQILVKRQIRWENLNFAALGGGGQTFCINTLEWVLKQIDSLQQERPKVDIEKEIDAIWNPRFNLGWDEKSLLSINHSAFETIARHFFELGLKARKV